MHYHKHYYRNPWCIIINTITGTHDALSSTPLPEPMMHYHQHHYQNQWCIIINTITRSHDALSSTPLPDPMMHHHQHHYRNPLCIFINTITRTHDALSSTPLPEPMMHYHRSKSCGKLNGTWCHAGHLTINGTLKLKGHYCNGKYYHHTKWKYMAKPMVTNLSPWWMNSPFQ